MSSRPWTYVPLGAPTFVQKIVAIPPALFYTNSRPNPPTFFHNIPT